MITRLILLPVHSMKNVAIIGAAGAIGNEFVLQFAKKNDVKTVFAFSRTAKSLKHPKIISKHIECCESTIAACATEASKDSPLDAVIIATGLLHDNKLTPEKTIRDLSENKFLHLFRINTIYPALVMKHFLPHMQKHQPAICATLSARVGSIADNHLGGWYAYRASKAALNMLVKCTSIEIKRSNPQSIIVGLHPGTVDSQLSKPFQANVPSEKLFTAKDSVSKMINVLETLTANDSGKCFDYGGNEILP